MREIITSTEASIPHILAPPKKSDTLQEFLKNWDINYKTEISRIDLFNTDLTSTLSNQKKSYFVKAFYHIRGHFHDFLWFMGNHAPSEYAKKIIANNIVEEFGKSYNSHEQLYYDFAKSLGPGLPKLLISRSPNFMLS